MGLLPVANGRVRHPAVRMADRRTLILTQIRTATTGTRTIATEHGRTMKEIGAMTTGGEGAVAARSLMTVRYNILFAWNPAGDSFSLCSGSQAATLHVSI